MNAQAGHPVRSKGLDDGPAASLPLRARRHPLVTAVNKAFGQAGVWDSPASRRTPMIVGVSGGADSTALLLGCLALQGRRDRRSAGSAPIVAHVNHHLRRDADADQAHVEALASRFGLPCHVVHVRPGNMPGNLMGNARRLRYEALCSVASDCGAKWIAVAHHADDQLETMVMALCRGTGPDGLSGMRLVTPLREGIRLVRPLLGVRRRIAESMCEAAEAPWRDDPGNASPQRARARLRQMVTPVLDALWPDAALRVAATAELLAQAQAMVADRIAHVFGPPESRRWDRDKLRQESELVIGGGLRRAALALRPRAADRLTHEHAARASRLVRSRSTKPLRFSWPGGLVLRITSREVSIEDGQA